MLVCLLCVVAPGSSLADGDATTPAARDLSVAMDELRAAYDAWQENDREFKSLEKKAEASEVEVDEFSAFVEDLRGKVLDGCREVRELGGDPEGLGVGCRSLEQRPREASDATAKRETGGKTSRQARKAAETPAGEKTTAAETGEAKSTAENQGEQSNQLRPASDAPGDEARQASRSDDGPGVDSGRQSDPGLETRRARPSSAASSGGDQVPATMPPRQRPPVVPGSPARVDAPSLPQSESQAYQSQLKALEAELDGYLSTQLSKVREKAANRRQTQAQQSQASAGYGSEDGVGAAGSNGAWGGGESLSGAGMQPKEPGVGPGVQKDGSPPRWNLPPGVGDGSDDDVVARQLREAAQSETDPETRRRLWEEYKKYKDST